MSERIRIVRVITRLNVGGPAIQAIELSDRLTAAGWPTRLIHGRLGEGEADMRPRHPVQAAQEIYLASLRRPPKPLDDLAALWRLFREMRRFQPTIVHTHTAKAGALGRTAAALYNATRGGRPRARVVHTYHGHVLDGYFTPRVAAIYTGVERLLARVTDAIVAISPEIRSQLATVFRIGCERQYRLIPLGFDLSPLAAVDAAARRAARADLGLPPEALVVATLGRLTDIKRPELFVDTAALVAPHHPDAVFLVVGDGELRGSLESRVAALGLEDRVRFLGWRRDVERIHAATDVFLLTSRNEGTPVAVIEAMAAEVACVAVDVGGVRDVLVDAAVGVVCADHTPQALAREVSALLADPGRRAAIGTAARASVLARYGIGRLVGDIRGLYEELQSR
jgi:glycosyltransferase involved in cell wall biosynthesis